MGSGNPVAAVLPVAKVAPSPSSPHPGAGVSPWHVEPLGVPRSISLLSPGAGEEPFPRPHCSPACHCSQAPIAGPANSATSPGHKEASLSPMREAGKSSHQASRWLQLRLMRRPAPQDATLCAFQLSFRPSFCPLCPGALLTVPACWALPRSGVPLCLPPGGPSRGRPSVPLPEPHPRAAECPREAKRARRGLGQHGLSAEHRAVGMGGSLSAEQRKEGKKTRGG